MSASVYDHEGRRKYLNQPENTRFLEALKGKSSEHETFCRTLFYTGCRVSEALNLTGSDIDYGEDAVKFRTLKKREKKEYRWIIIPPELLEQLRAVSAGRTNEPVWSFCRSTGWHIVKRVMSQAGIQGPQATVKGLRHGFGVRCAMNKIPVTKISEWMGHSDPSTTEIYLNIRGQEERELMQRTW